MIIGTRFNTDIILYHTCFLQIVWIYNKHNTCTTIKCRFDLTVQHSCQNPQTCTIHFTQSCCLALVLAKCKYCVFFKCKCVFHTYRLKRTEYLADDTLIDTEFILSSSYIVVNINWGIVSKIYICEVESWKKYVSCLKYLVIKLVRLWFL